MSTMLFKTVEMFLLSRWRRLFQDILVLLVGLVFYLNQCKSVAERIMLLFEFTFELPAKRWL